MVRDLQRIAAERGLRFALPAPFPQNSLRRGAAGAGRRRRGLDRALHAGRLSWPSSAMAPTSPTAASSSRSSTAYTLIPSGFCRASRSPTSRRASSSRRRKRRQRGIFGAPSFVCRGELFWGDDRLEHALAWACARPEQAFTTHSSAVRQDRVRGSTMETTAVHKTLVKTLGISVATAALALFAYGASAQREEGGRQPRRRRCLQDHQGPGWLRGPRRRLHVGRRKQGRQGQGESQGLLPRQAEGAGEEAGARRSRRIAVGRATEIRGCASTGIAATFVFGTSTHADVWLTSKHLFPHCCISGLAHVPTGMERSPSRANSGDAT